MGADVRVQKPKGLDEDVFYQDCQKVPIDANIEGSCIHFHYAYWGIDHASECERFVSDFIRKHKVKGGKWCY